MGYRYWETAAEEGFIDYEQSVVYPFSYGLSYISFEQSFDSITRKTDKDGHAYYEAKVTVRNTGDVAGKDVVQIYVKAPKGELDKPERELKGFAKTPELAPGESCTVSVFVPRESLASYDESRSAWVVDSGRYTFVAACDAMGNSLKKTVKVE